MKEKYWKPILMILLVTLVIGLITDKEDKPFNKSDLDTSNKIVNATEDKFLDTIVLTGLKLNNVKNTIVLVAHISKEVLKENPDLEGYILNRGNMYYIAIVKSSKDESIRILSHELVHYNQLYRGRLFNDGKITIWEGKDYTGNTLEYKTRPWEAEAFKNADKLERRIKNRLYK